MTRVGSQRHSKKKKKKIYLLTAIGLSPGGSTRLHTNNTQNNKNNNRTTQKQLMWAVARLCEFYPGIWLTTEEKARTNLSHGKNLFSHSILL